MKIFVDTANLVDIEEALKRGFIRGITTNPSIIAKEPKANFEKHIRKIVDLIKKYQPEAHLSIEVFSTEPGEIIRQAKLFVKKFKLPGLSIKIPIGWNELEVIKNLASEGISVNCTCNMMVSQGIMSAAAGAKFISFFWGRIRDGGNEENFAGPRISMRKKMVLREEDFSPENVIPKARFLLAKDYPEAHIIVGSIRCVDDIIQAGLAGAHIATVPPKFFKDMVFHFKTEEVVNQFMADFQNWLK